MVTDSAMAAGWDPMSHSYVVAEVMIALVRLLDNKSSWAVEVGHLFGVGQSGAVAAAAAAAAAAGFDVVWPVDHVVTAVCRRLCVLGVN